jgi:hypothetical protein
LKAESKTLDPGLRRDDESEASNQKTVIPAQAEIQRRSLTTAKPTAKPTAKTNPVQ